MTSWDEMTNRERGAWVRCHAASPADFRRVGRPLNRWELMELFKLDQSELAAVLKGKDYPKRDTA